MSAAVNYAAYMGITDSQGINDIGKKFSKATFGEVGELKDIGINIDVNAGAFKQLVEDMKEATGVSESMAKQMAIAKQIINQVEFTSGQTSKNMLDGWTQLNITLDNFKQILGQVGGIFSTVFGPALKVFNSILSIPFVKSTTAWVVAIGSVYIGFISLLGVLKRIKTLLEGSKNIRNLSNKEIEQANKLQKQFVLLKQREYHLQQRIQELHANRQSLKQQAEKLGQGVSDRSTKIGKEYNADANKLTPINKDLAKTQKDIKAIADSLSGLGQDAVQAIASMTGLDEEFQLFVNALALSKIATKGNTASIIAETAAKIKNTIATWASASANKSVSIGSAFTSVLVALGGALKWVGTFFVKTLPALLKPVLTVLIGTVLPILASIGKILLLVAGAIIIPFDGVTMIINKLMGKDLYTGTISKWIAEFVFKVESNDKLLKNRLNRYKQGISAYNDFVKGLNLQLKEMNFQKYLNNLIPQDAIKQLAKRRNNINSSIKRISRDIIKLKEEYIKAYLIDDKNQRDSAIKSLNSKSEEFKKKRIQLQNKLNEVDSMIESQQGRLKQMIQRFVNAMKEIHNKLNEIQIEFSFGYKKGKFGKFSDEVSAMINENLENSLRKALGRFKSWYDPREINRQSTGNLQQQQKLLNRLYNTARDNYKYQLSALWKQRQAAVENLNSMNQLIKQAYSFKETAQSGVQKRKCIGNEIADKIVNTSG